MDQDSLISAVEAILLAADRPVTVTRLKEVFGEEGPSESDIDVQLQRLKLRYATPEFGFELREAQGGFHFVTKVKNSEFVRRFLETKPFRLGRSTLEALAIIAYRQPITRAEIDSVRGIDSSHLLRSLMERGLVTMAGKAEVPGRPVQYATTPKFLETVGLASLAELPPLSELEQLQGDTEDPIKTLEAGMERFMTEAPDAATLDGRQATEGLEEIDSLIQTADRGGKDVYESPIHAAVATENEEAMKAWFEFSKPKRKFGKKTARYDEITAGTVTTTQTIVVDTITTEALEALEAATTPDPTAVN